MSTTDSIPSPWKTLSRYLYRALALILALALLWTLWYAYAASRYNHVLDVYRGRGIPIAAEQFVTPPAAPTRNACVFIATAAGALSLTRDEIDLVQGDPRRTVALSPSDAALVKAMLEKAATTLEFIRKARQAPQTVWPGQVFLYNGIIRGRTLSDYRQLSDVLRIAALYYHQQHRDDLALEIIRDMEALAATCDRGRVMLCHYVAIHIYSQSAESIFDIAPDLQVQPASQNSAAVDSLIKELLNQSPLHEGQHAALLSDRIRAIYVADDLERGTVLLRPMFRLDCLRELTSIDAKIDAIGRASTPFPLVNPKLPPAFTWPEENIDILAHALTCVSNLTRNGLIKNHHRTLVHREAAAVRLAIRRYELAHKNLLPSDLPMLVPVFLPRLPVDYFRADAGPLTYVPANRIIYSFSENGIDDGGTSTTLRREGLVNWDDPDAVYYLGGAIGNSPTSEPAAPSRN